VNELAETAYSTDHPDVIAAWRDIADREDVFRTQAKAAAELVGKNRGVLFSTNVLGARVPLGLAHIDPADPPTGWTFKARRDCLVPVSADAKRWLAAQQPPKPDLRGVMAEHGLPRNQAVGGGRMGTPELFLHEGTIWVHYRGRPDGSFGGPFDTPDPAVWTPRRLSEYHTAREAALEQMRQTV